MFQHAFQNGPAVEVINSGEKTPQWVINKSKWKSFDKSVKGYIITLDSHTAKLQFPSNERQSLSLVQPYLVLQIFLIPVQSFTLELGLTDISGSKRRLMFSSASKEIISTPLHARIPNGPFLRGVWANISIDLVGFVNACFPGSTFRSLDSITIHSFCKIRKVFTMKNPIFDTSDAGTHMDGAEMPPKNFEFPPGVQYVNQLIVPAMVVAMELEAPIETPIKSIPKKTCLAFGTKIPANTAPTLKQIPKKEPRTASPQRKQTSNTSTSFFSKRDNNTAKLIPDTRSPSKISGTFERVTTESFASKNYNRIGSAASTRYDAKEDIIEQEEILEANEEEKKSNKSPSPALKNSSQRFSDFSESFKSDEIESEYSKQLSFSNPLDDMGDEEIKEDPSTTENSILKSAQRKLTNYNQPSYGAAAQSIEEEIDEERYNPNIYTQNSIDHNFYPFAKENNRESDSPVPHPTFYAQGLNEATQVRPFTPPFAGLSSMRNIKASYEEEQQAEIEGEGEGEEEAVELVYDPVLKCYYDPSTHEYYEVND
ncbi:unnamed protein product [Blepharisma stoltei]|uniref:CFA20 domain-containing protein n=1 Tax=Blepharisma stoltei TaxID=1481888 RepID=A0AAU9K6X0_9CILI|nr:unnamed protein product [Blepharisma stoltei]